MSLHLENWSRWGLRRQQGIDYLGQNADPFPYLGFVLSIVEAQTLVLMQPRLVTNAGEKVVTRHNNEPLLLETLV